MVGEWVDTTLGAVLTLQRGFDLPETEREPGPYPVIASTGPVGTHTAAMVKGPGVVIGRSGSLGGGQFIQSNFWPLNTTLWVKDFKGNDRRFCYYLLKSIDLAQFNSGSGVPTLNRNHIHPLAIRAPKDPNEQRAIAYILGTLDDKIELNRKMNETLEAMARAIFKSWFVDFDPVRAKADLRKPSGMDAATAALFPDSFVDSPFGPIPKGWKLTSLDKIVEIIGGGTPKTTKPEYWDGDIPWFSIIDAPSPSEIFVIDTQKKITRRGLDESSARILPSGTTIISARGTVGKLAIAGVPMAINQSCYGLSGKEGLRPFFTHFLLRNILSELQMRTHGSIFDTITRDTFKAVTAALPSQSLSDRFEITVGPLLAQIIANLKMSRNLITMCGSLLPKLLSGEIRVKNKENLVMEV